MFNDENIPSRDRLSVRMSSYWAEFAYSGSPGKGRGRLSPEWTSWSNDSASSDKYIIFDDESDGGIRMSGESITLNTLRERVLADTTFPDEAARSEMYDCLLAGTDVWQKQEFLALGGRVCDMETYNILK